MLDAQTVNSLAQQWQVPVLGLEYPTSGTMNEIVVLVTSTGRVVLRGHRRHDRNRVAFEHEVMTCARHHSVPVPELITTPSGAAIVERDGRLYSLSEYATGQQVPRDSIDVAQAAAMGHMLATLHTALAAMPTARAPRAHREHDADATLRRIDQLLVTLETRGHREESDGWAIDRLRARVDWLQRNREPPPTPPRDTEQVIHGDYHDANLFFDDGAVSAVLDWDKAEVRTPAEEVVRTMHLSFGLDPQRSRRFLDAYRSARDLDQGQLHDVAATYGYHRACDLWLFETIYLHGDERPRRFLTPGTFTPFLDQWQRLAPAL